MVEDIVGIQPKTKKADTSPEGMISAYNPPSPDLRSVLRCLSSEDLPI
jgi:hypothetical protein